MNGQGHASLNMSTAGSGQFAQVASSGRLCGDTPGTTEASTSPRSSDEPYNLGSGSPRRWGDYSQTVVDPTDNMTFWTFQEYANAPNSWGVQVIQLQAPPPRPSTATPVAPATTVAHGELLGGCGHRRYVDGWVRVLRPGFRPGWPWIPTTTSPPPSRGGVQREPRHLRGPDPRRRSTRHPLGEHRGAGRHHHQSGRPGRDDDRPAHRRSGGDRPNDPLHDRHGPGFAQPTTPRRRSLGAAAECGIHREALHGFQLYAAARRSGPGPPASSPSRASR